MACSTVQKRPPALFSRILGYTDFNALPAGISFAGDLHPADHVELLTDHTWLGEDGNRHLQHEIFDEILAMVAGARRLLVLDLFLFNDLTLREKAPVRPLARELTDALLARRRDSPDMHIVFITDPCNIGWGGLHSPYLTELSAAGIDVVITNLDVLRDSSPAYSFLWRALVRPFGNRVGGLLPNPFGEGTITLRSLLHLPNMKANHRKTVIADDGDRWLGLVTSMNPHDASFAHRNFAIRFEGPAVADLYLTERAVMEMSGATPPPVAIAPPRSEDSPFTLQVLTEGKIKTCVLEAIARATVGDELSMILFYLSDRQIVAALETAVERGVRCRIVLDPSKDAFGWKKYGVPNRPVAHRLSQRGVAIRWADTHGEQCHTKMMLAKYADGDALLLSGSANFTRRNLDDFNLETDVCVLGPADAGILQHAGDVFEMIWNNHDGRPFTVDYERYEERSKVQQAIYWLMETTGFSTF